MRIEESIRNLRKERTSLEDKILKLGPLLEGSLITRHVSCGNPNCRCSSGRKPDLHGPYYYLSKKVRGKTKLIYLSNKEELKEMAQNYRLFQGSLRRVRQINRHLEKLFSALRGQRQAEGK